MAHIWRMEADGSWLAEMVPDETRFVLVDCQSRHGKPQLKSIKRVVRRRRDSGTRFLLIRTGGARSERWFVVVSVSQPASQTINRNGQPISTGMALLEDRDVLTLAGGARCREDWVFTTARVPEVEVYEGGAEAFCSRCKLPLEAGATVVVCPGCFAIHHQTHRKECWTYTETCAECDRATDLGGDAPVWSPDEL